MSPPRTVSELELADLIGRMAAGERRALIRLHVCLETELRLLIRSQVRDNVTAERVLRSTLIELWTMARRRPSGGGVRDWIEAVVARRCAERAIGVGSAAPRPFIRDVSDANDAQNDREFDRLTGRNPLAAAK